jgi:hypothetical protein
MKDISGMDVPGSWPTADKRPCGLMTFYTCLMMFNGFVIVWLSHKYANAIYMGVRLGGVGFRAAITFKYKLHKEWMHLPHIHKVGLIDTDQVSYTEDATHTDDVMLLEGCWVRKVLRYWKGVELLEVVLRQRHGRRGILIRLYLYHVIQFYIFI